MEALQWVQDHGFDLFQTVGIIGSLWFTHRTVKTDEKGRRLDSLLKVTEHHFNIWSLYLSDPSLREIMAKEESKDREPTDTERVFVNFLILHLNLSFQASKLGLYTNPERLCDDIRSFFSRPIPYRVWMNARTLQDADFVAFVDGALSLDKVK